MTTGNLETRDVTMNFASQKYWIKQYGTIMKELEEVAIPKEADGSAIEIGSKTFKVKLNSFIPNFFCLVRKYTMLTNFLECQL